MSFEQGLEKAQIVGQDCGQKWDYFEQLLGALGADTEQKYNLLQNARNNALNARYACFEASSQNLKQEIIQRQIATHEGFNRKWEALRAMVFSSNQAGQNNEIQREYEGILRELRLLWDDYKAIEAVKDNIERAKFNFKNALGRKVRIEDAVKTHLTPILEDIEALGQRHGANPEITKLLNAYVETVRTADPTRVATLATMGQFDTIISELEEQDDDFEQSLHEEDGTFVGTKTKGDAINWYLNRARNAAEKKAKEYLQLAQAQYIEGLTIAAHSTLAQVNTLKYLPANSEIKKETELFRTDTLQPKLDKLASARNMLSSIPLMATAKDAISTYNQALVMWSQFDTKENSLTQQAQTAIVAQIRAEVEQDLFLYEQKKDSIFWPQTISPERARDLEEQMQFSAKFAPGDIVPRLTQLLSIYKQQLLSLEELKKDEKEALDLLGQGNVEGAYKKLVPWSKIFIEKFPTAQPGVLGLWNELQARFDIQSLSTNAEKAISSKYDIGNLEGEIKALGTLIEQVSQALVSNEREANILEMRDQLVSLQEKRSLLQAIQHIQKKEFEQGSQLINDNIGRESLYYQSAQIFKKEADDKIVVDGTLESAINQAKELSQNGYWENAYEILKAQVEKRNARNYSVFKQLYDSVTLEYAHSLRASIDTIIKKPQVDDFQRLESLGQKLKETSPQLFAAVRDHWQKTVDNLRAAYHLRLAEQQSDRTHAWTKALESQQKLEHPNFEQIHKIRESYLKALLKEVEQEVRQNSDDQGAVQGVIDYAFQEVDKLRGEVSGLLYLKARASLNILNAEEEEIPENFKAYINELSSILVEPSLPDAEHKEYAASIKTITALMMNSRETQKILDNHHSLSEWIEKSGSWQAILEENRAYRGMQRWTRTLYTDCLKQLDECIQLANELWEQIEPQAKKYLLTQLPVSNLRAYQDELWQLCQTILGDYTGLQAPSNYSEEIYITLLSRACLAITYLYNIEIVPLPETSVVDFQFTKQPSDPASYALQLASLLASKLSHLQALLKLKEVVTDLQVAVRETGDFQTLNDTLLPINEGDLQRYKDHISIQTLLIAIKKERETFAIYMDAAKEIKVAFETENFEKVLSGIPFLNTDEATDYSGRNLVKVKDPFGSELLDDTKDIGEAVEAKVEQVAILVEWLRPLISEDKLFAQIRDEKGQLLEYPNFDPAPLTLVNFQDQDLMISQFCSQARYDDARNHLLIVELGIGGSSQSPEFYEPVGRVQSLLQGIRTLEGLPFKKKSTLISFTAIAIYNWSKLLWDKIQYDMACVEFRYEHIDQSQKLFNYERNRFLEALEGYDNRQLKAQHPEFLVQMKEAYERIKTVKSDPIKTDNLSCQYALYPLAPNWTGLDNQYKRHIR